MLEEFDNEVAPPQPPWATEQPSRLPLIVALVLLIAVGVAAWLYFSTRSEPAQTASTAPAPKPAATLPSTAMQPLCSPADTNTAAVPPLSDSDSFVNKAASGLSAHPRVAAWLATDNAIRNFVVAIDNIGSGATPAARMGALRPAGTFRVRQARDGVFIDPRSFERYSPIADAVDSVDSTTAAELCGTLKPRLVEAYAELGREGSFDTALERAIVALLRTPPAGPDTRLVPNGASYAFEDEALENLTPAQKQLARMGPRNVRIIQDKLRQVALAIGIPADRLP